MRTEEQKELERLAVELNNAFVDQLDRSRAVDSARDRLREAEEVTKRAKDALLRALSVGRNVPMKSVRIPETVNTIVVSWTPKPSDDPGYNGGRGDVTVYHSGPNGSKIV